MTLFRDLSIGDTFDFISPDRTGNSFYARCVKLSARTYIEEELFLTPAPHHTIGSINASVYHVAAKSHPFFFATKQEA